MFCSFGQPFSSHHGVTSPPPRTGGACRSSATDRTGEVFYPMAARCDFLRALLRREEPRTEARRVPAR